MDGNMAHHEPYITPQTLEARASAWHAELAQAGIGRHPEPLPPAGPPCW